MSNNIGYSESAIQKLADNLPCLNYNRIIWKESSINSTCDNNRSCWYYPDQSNYLLKFCVEDGVWDDSQQNIIKITNKIISINDFLKFQGDMEITTSGDISFVANGKFYLENVKFNTQPNNN